MKTNVKKFLLFIIMFAFVLTFFTTISFAGEDLDTEDYKTDLKYSDASDIFDKGASVLKVLRNIATIVSVVVITIIGVRYIVGSVEQKAEYKQTMMPVIIGCILVVSISTILTVIQSVWTTSTGGTSGGITRPGDPYSQLY